MVKNFHFALLALALAGAGMAERAIAADPAQTVHGSADVYAAPGIALAWGILRGASETTTIVVVRVAADAQAFGSLEVVGVDPFTQKTERRLVPTALKDTVDVQVPRAQFADFPRTELRFFRVGFALGERRAEARRLLSRHPGHDTGVSHGRRAREISRRPPQQRARKPRLQEAVIPLSTPLILQS